MHSRLKSTVSGLAVVAAFVFGSTLFGEPLPQAGAPVASHEQSLEEAGERVAAALESAEAAASRAARRGDLRRLHLTMPYFAVGSLLALAGES